MVLSSRHKKTNISPNNEPMIHFPCLGNFYKNQLHLALSLSFLPFSLSMDFGVVGLDNNGSGLLCSDNTTTTTSVVSDAAAETNKQKLYRSEDDWKGLKVAKTISDLPKSPLLRSNSLTSGQQMLSFSAPNSQTVATTLPYYHYPSSYSSSVSYTTTNPAGYYGNGGLTPGSMQGGVVSGGRGPFTPSQWMELEHQALIYKYINANIPIPSYLLTPIRKALDSAGFSLFSGLRTNSFGWGAFHLGFSNSNDPEPGRCRRTDGKKWRCSRDAIADHKYCERHMNRGRHRSRKPVEGQSGHSVSGTTNNTNTVKLTSASAAVVPGGGASNNPDLSSHHQLSNLQKTATSQSSAHPHGDRNLLNKANPGERYQETAGLSIISPAISMKENHYSIPNPKQQNPYVESSRGEFGQVCSDSLLNPLNRSSSLVNSSRYGASDDINDCESKSQHGLRQFMDDWPNSRPERSWSDIEMHSERTQLSISIPMAAASDFMSSTSSPTNDKIATSPLRLSREFQMGLGVGNFANERKNRQANWIPISWESSSLGGPLGEVLHSTNNSSGDGKNAAALNFMSEGWDSCPSPQLASSPTGVLQKAALVYLSNSSAGSSPTAVDNGKMIEGSSLCSGVSGSTLMNPALNSL